MPSIDQSVNEKNTCWGVSAVAEIFDKENRNQISLIAVLIGGAMGDRTPDLNTASVALSQLSYCPMS
jgi:hypothetical protein